MELSYRDTLVEIMDVSPDYAVRIGWMNSERFGEEESTGLHFSCLSHKGDAIGRTNRNRISYPKTIIGSCAFKK